MVDNIEDASIENSNSMSMIRHKIVFIGDVAVGKTSILNRFLEDKFKENYEVYKISKISHLSVLIFLQRI